MYKEHDYDFEMELDILASLVVEMDGPDAHILEVISTIAERLQEHTATGKEANKLACQIARLIQEMRKGSLPFEKGYVALSSSIQMLQRDLQDQALQAGRGVLPGESGMPGVEASPGGEAGAGDTSPGGLPVAVTSQSFDPNDSDNAMFIAEVEECLASAEMSLLALEKNPGDRSHLNEVFRCFHNIKGISGFVNLGDFLELCHHAESLMEGARTGTLEFTGRVTEAVFDALDLLKDMVHLLKVSSADFPYKTPEMFGDVITALKNQGVTSPEQASTGSGKMHSIPSGKSQSGRFEDGDNAQIDEVCNGPTCGTGSSLSGSLDNGVSRQAVVLDEVVRVSTRRLDALLDEIGELVIANSMVAQEIETSNYADSRLAQNVSRMTKIVRQLQELTMGMRMVSLEPTFNKLARIVRDLCHKTGVEVGFVCDGGDTELDRKIVELITNPMIHLVRNAIDHGIEQPDEREALGKPRQGQVHLSAFHQGGSVAVRIEDDGRGLDEAQIAEKAIELGLMKPNANLAGREIYQFIFAPGFSTSHEVTDISGRGVGMDVVKRNIESLRGKIDIQTQPGAGTAFTLWLPLTMAIIDGMVVTVGEQRFIVPSISIQEAVRPEPSDIKTVMGKGEYISIRGELIPLYRLHSLLGLEGARINPWEALVLVTYLGEGRCGILVDDLIGQQQVVVKPAGYLVDRLHFISGAAIMGDGRVALILDPSQVMKATGT